MSSLSIDSLNSLYGTQVSNAAGSANNLEQTLQNTDLSNSTDEELMSVCKQFEAYFLEQVFKEMKNTVPKSDTSSDSGMSMMKDYYEEEMIKEYASEASQQGDGVGLAQTLYEQMKRNYNV